MLVPSRLCAIRLIFGCYLIGNFVACANSPTYSRTGTPHNAFISYTPAAENSGRLRLSVKDLIDVKGVVTTGGSEYLSKTAQPAARDAKCLAIARARNVVIVGKTNLSELAVAPSGLNRYYGTAQNPLIRKPHLIPGGSSSGAAVAVATGLADVSFGTDTAGSVRVPAACSGVVGLKTTFGLVSLDGVIPIEPKHLDTVGPLGKDIAHTVEGMDLLQAGFAGKYQAAVAANPSGRAIRIGRLYLNGTDPAIDRAIDESLQRAGFRVVRLNDDFKSQWGQANTDGTNVAAAGAWISDQAYLDKPGVSPRTKAAIALGQLTYNTAYTPALSRRSAWQRTLRRTFERVDFIAVPTLQTLPPKFPFPFGGTPLFEATMLGIQNTMAVNFAGNPALAVPVPVADDRIPFTSVQLVGPRLSEAGLLNAGRLIEKTRPPVAAGVSR